jgi:hypothetical protein
MSLSSTARLVARATRFVLTRPSEIPPVNAYRADSMILTNKNLAALFESKFQRAYTRGLNSGHRLHEAFGDINIEYRAYVVCWAAAHAAHLSGDFVECGVNTGIYALAICDYLDFNSLDKSFWLFDTYEGVPAAQASERERKLGRGGAENKAYPECYKLVKENFAPYPRVQLVRGLVPDTLTTVNIDRVAFLSLDMNIAHPEVSAIEHFWPKMVSGGAVVLDDYAWRDHEEQHRAMDGFAHSVGVQILTLPTGQGLILKP